MNTETDDIIGEQKSRSGWAFETSTTLIAGGRRFDIAKASMVADWSYGQRRDDFSHKEETLYRTPRGNFLLVVEGWFHHTGNGTGPGHISAAITPAQARRWLEFRGHDAELEELFGSEIEDA
jgi:hypothetical protein